MLLVFTLAIEDLPAAADFFLPIHERSAGVDGWVSLEISPMLVNDAEGSLAAAQLLHAQAARRNLFIMIPGTRERLKAIEESIFAGIPVNVTLLFSTRLYLATADAYLRGIERRLAAGLSPVVESVALVFVSRWDSSVNARVAAAARNRLGIAMARRTYRAYREMLACERWQALAKAGAHPQRLLWASTGTKDAAVSPTLYVEALAAPDTVDTMPDKTLEAFARQGEPRGVLAERDASEDEMLADFARDGIDVEELAETLQQDASRGFASSWTALFRSVDVKVAALGNREIPPA